MNKQVLDRRLRRFQEIKAARKAVAVARAAAPGAPNPTIAKNVLKWRQRQEERCAQE